MDIMLQAVYEKLLLSHLDPRWVADEIHVDVFGRRFMLAAGPGGLSMRTLATTSPVLFDDPEDAFAAMGLRGVEPSPTGYGAQVWRQVSPR